MYPTSHNNSQQTPSLHELGVYQSHEEDIIYSLTVTEIAEAQKTDPNIHKLTKNPQYTRKLVESTQVLYNGTAMVLPTAL
jgi:hypothetical protein